MSIPKTIENKMVTWDGLQDYHNMIKNELPNLGIDNLGGSLSNTQLLWGNGNEFEGYAGECSLILGRENIGKDDIYRSLIIGAWNTLGENDPSYQQIYNSFICGDSNTLNGYIDGVYLLGNFLTADDNCNHTLIIGQYNDTNLSSDAAFIIANGNETEGKNTFWIRHDGTIGSDFIVKLGTATRDAFKVTLTGVVINSAVVGDSFTVNSDKVSISSPQSVSISSYNSTLSLSGVYGVKIFSELGSVDISGGQLSFGSNLTNNGTIEKPCLVIGKYNDWSDNCAFCIGGGEPPESSEMGSVISRNENILTINYNGECRFNGTICSTISDTQGVLISDSGLVRHALFPYASSKIVQLAKNKDIVFWAVGNATSELKINYDSELFNSTFYNTINPYTLPTTIAFHAGSDNKYADLKCGKVLLQNTEDGKTETASLAVEKWTLGSTSLYEIKTTHRINAESFINNNRNASIDENGDIECNSIVSTTQNFVSVEYFTPGKNQWKEESKFLNNDDQAAGFLYTSVASTLIKKGAFLIVYWYGGQDNLIPLHISDNLYCPQSSIINLQPGETVYMVATGEASLSEKFYFKVACTTTTVNKVQKGKIDLQMEWDSGASENHAKIFNWILVNPMN